MRIPFVTLTAAALTLGAMAQASAQTSTIEEAQRLFYNGRYQAAADATADGCVAETVDLVVCELRTSALLFQIKRAFGEPADKDKAWPLCAVCQELMSTFLADIAKGQAAARAQLMAAPGDTDALFMLGKLDLNYVWLQLGTLGRKTGWSEYWEARKSLDKVLKQDPAHIRARVARAWIDYIVGARVPRGTRWLLGGGNKKKGLSAVREATTIEGDPFSRAEAGFALWDMQVREKDISGAVTTARGLAYDFPDNEELRKFLALHSTPAAH